MVGIVEVVMVFGVLAAIGVAAARANRWLNRRLPSDVNLSETSDVNLSETIATLERRITELEDRVDFAERALTELRARDRLPPQS